MARDDEYADYVAARWPALVRSAVLLGCSTAEAEDVTQSTLLRCYTSWHRVRRADDRDAYVYRVLVNVLAKSRTRKWWGERPTEQLPEPASAAPDVAQSLDLRSLLARLSPAHREVLVLRFGADLSELQVAAVLGIAPGTVKSRVSRALAAVDRSQMVEGDAR